MKSSIKIALVLLAIAGTVIMTGPSTQPSAASHDLKVLSRTLPGLKLGTIDSSPVIREHDTGKVHLCHQDSDCGTAHKCCSGKCYRVDTCG